MGMADTPKDVLEEPSDDLKIYAYNGMIYFSETLKLIEESFKEEPYKIKLWFLLKNPMLGNMSPIHMFMRGRGKKVLELIENAKEGSLP